MQSNQANESSRRSETMCENPMLLQTLRPKPNACCQNEEYKLSLAR